MQYPAPAAIACAHLKLTSSEWENSVITLLKGQAAFEVDADGKPLYLLAGDGNPVNYPTPYTRLRVHPADAVIKIGGIEKTVQEWMDFFDTKIKDNKTDINDHYKELTDAIADEEKRATGEETELQKQITENEEARLEYNRISNDYYEEKLGELGDSDEELQEQITDNKKDFSEKVGELQSEDARLDTKIDNTKTALQKEIDDDIEAHNTAPADEAHVGVLAPLDSPHFTGVPKVPQPSENGYKDLDQAATVEDILGLYEITVAVSDYHRAVDGKDEVQVGTDPGTDKPILKTLPAILRIQDDDIEDEKGNSVLQTELLGGKSNLRQVDKISYTGKLTGEQEELYKILIDATATYIRDVDGVHTREPFAFRIADGQGAGITGLRLLDCVLAGAGGGGNGNCDCFEDASWID